MTTEPSPNSVNLPARLRGHAKWLHENHGHRPSGRNPIGEDCADAADEIERLRRQVEFMEAFSADLTINGRPWREMFDALNALVSDPVRAASDG